MEVTVKKVLICGGRDYKEKYYFWEFLDAEFRKRGWVHPPDKYGNWLPCVKIIHGGAKGADTLADDYAVTNWCPVKEYPADWTKHGKLAGSIRNNEMLVKEQPDLVIAFPGGKGTANMIDQAKRRGVEVIEIK